MTPNTNFQDCQFVIHFKSDKAVTQKPIKRTTKSFNGCLPCKRRKIKCDETKDECRNCTRSNLACTWGERRKRQQANKTIKESTDEITTSLVLHNCPAQVRLTDSVDSETRLRVPEVPLYAHVKLDSSLLDVLFLSHFTDSFLPTIAQPHFHHPLPQENLIISAAESSDTLREIFIACGASLAALEDVSCKLVARERYTRALGQFVSAMKNGSINGEEEWFLVAVQVLQTLCLRDSFFGSNATRCAFHFHAAYKVLAHRLFSQPHHSVEAFSPLQKLMTENFIFNYSITIFFCEKVHIQRYIPDPYQFFARANATLNQMSLADGSPRISRVSMLSFQIAAKCSWLCRLGTYRTDSDRRLQCELLLLAETLLFSLDSTDYHTHSHEVQKTVYIAKVVLRTSMILLRKMVYPATKAASLQGIVTDIASDIMQSCNQKTIFPIWSLMIAASSSLDDMCRTFFKRRLEHLFNISKSQIVRCVLLHLEGLWELYSDDEPFELLFDSNVLSEVCTWGT